MIVYTLGLTEGWRHKRSGTVFPTAPGTIAGDYDPDKYEFINFKYHELYEDFEEFRSLVHTVNPNARFILTVSPVPLAATASGEHVLSATTYSKSVLRAVAGDLSEGREDTDYFPSYEIITGGPARGMFFDETLRNVTPQGVQTVMSHFFREHGTVADDSNSVQLPVQGEESDVLCEEVLLEAFGR
ncbi:hypothetical protein GCM10027402_25500 [Arthrobacter monumenti]